MRTFVTALLVSQVISEQNLGLNNQEINGESQDMPGPMSNNYSEILAATREQSSLPYLDEQGALPSQTEAIIMERSQPKVTKVKISDLRERMMSKDLTSDEQKFMDGLRDSYLGAMGSMRKGVRMTDEQKQGLELFNKVLGSKETSYPAYRNSQGGLSIGKGEDVSKNHDDEYIEIPTNSDVRSEAEPIFR